MPHLHPGCSIRGYGYFPEVQAPALGTSPLLLPLLQTSQHVLKCFQQRGTNRTHRLQVTSPSSHWAEEIPLRARLGKSHSIFLYVSKRGDSRDMILLNLTTLAESATSTSPVLSWCPCHPCSWCQSRHRTGVAETASKKMGVKSSVCDGWQVSKNEMLKYIFKRKNEAVLYKTAS